MNAPELDIAMAASEDALQVVLCETSRVQRAMLAATLADAGLVVCEVGDGEAAMDALRRTGADIFITGVETGAVSGLEACWRLKADAATAFVHTIVVTSSEDVSRLAEALDAGADDFIRKPFDEIELKARLRAAARIVRLQRRLRAEAETDALTGAANRRAFMRALEREIEEADRLGVPLALAMLDLDHFKAINDTHGHAAGDRVLARAVAAFRAELSGAELLGRLGGEEFAALLPRAGADAAVEAGERLRLAAEHLVVENDHGAAIPVTTSVGAAVREAGATADASELLRRADEALYAAKEGGRNQVRLA